MLVFTRYNVCYVSWLSVAPARVYTIKVITAVIIADISTNVTTIIIALSHT